MIEKAMTCNDCGKPMWEPKKQPVYDETGSYVCDRNVLQPNDVCKCSEEVFDKIGNIGFPTDQEIEEASKKIEHDNELIRNAFMRGAQWAITKIIINND